MPGQPIPKPQTPRWGCAVAAAAAVAAAGLTQVEEEASSAEQDAADTALVAACTAPCIPVSVNPTLKQVAHCVSTCGEVAGTSRMVMRHNTRMVPNWDVVVQAWRGLPWNLGCHHHCPPP